MIGRICFVIGARVARRWINTGLITLDFKRELDPAGSLRSGLASLGPSYVFVCLLSRSDPPSDPRFLASLGSLSWVELHH
jgi:hypothetical protein